MKFRENLEIRDTELNQIKIELEITKKSSENQDDLDKIKFELEETRQKLKTLENSQSLLEQVKILDFFKNCYNSIVSNQSIFEILLEILWTQFLTVRHYSISNTIKNFFKNKMSLILYGYLSAMKMKTGNES